MIWFTEYWTENVGLTLRAKEVKRVKSKYQEIMILDTYEFGKVLVLDGLIQATEKDEFMYHEMLVHPALISHPKPERVLIIGGGDGGSVREALKHKTVKEVHLCEIDEEVIIISEKYLPKISEKLRDPKVKIFIEDGNKLLEEKDHQNYYDVIIIDSSDPVSESEVLFKEDFYKKVKNALRKNGIMVAQTESPILQEDYFKNAVKNIKKVFNYTGVYVGAVPTYPSGLWSYTIASDDIDITKTKPRKTKFKNLNTKYFSDKLYSCLFNTPSFIEKILSEV